MLCDLLVEDDPLDAELTIRELRKSGYELEWQRVDTPAAYEAALSPDLDVILSDFQMPRFNGPRDRMGDRRRSHVVPKVLVAAAPGAGGAGGISVLHVSLR